MTLGLLIGALAGSLLATHSHADDWAQWRGHQRDGISRESGLLKEWPKEGPKLVWHVKDLGAGYSSPVVAGQELFILANEGLENEYVRALSVTDGKTIWTTKLGPVGEPKQQPAYPASRSSATVEGDAVYVMSSDGEVANLDRKTGKARWQKNVRKDFGGQYGKWAYAESPLVDGEKLVCTPGGPDATLVAFNKNTGAVIWKAAVPGGDKAGYASIVISKAGGVKQYVQFVEKGVVGIEAETGKFLWRHDRPAQGSPANIPTPIVHDDYVFVASNRGGGGLIRLVKEGDTFKVEPVYHSSKVPSAIGGAVKVGNELYGAAGNSLLCLDFLKGDVKWEDRSIGAASLLFANGHLYLRGENGEVALVEATPQGYQEKGRFAPPEPPNRGNSKAWAYPALANGRLYVRELGSLWCYDVKGGSVAPK
ncbi:MAG TPA: PQQ-binding-like beta-propeller repeat protein [Methylomirabilota bacterium]|nr:PQQ-binding-like beta-propeller repeat protein [Methylomirabilota bacterium]